MDSVLFLHTHVHTLKHTLWHSTYIASRFYFFMGGQGCLSRVRFRLNASMIHDLNKKYYRDLSRPSRVRLPSDACSSQSRRLTIKCLSKPSPASSVLAVTASERFKSTKSLSPAMKSIKLTLNQNHGACQLSCSITTMAYVRYFYS
jgi:hypothetical protein